MTRVSTERIARVERKTSETDIALTLNLDGSGVNDVETGSGFFDHMLTAFIRHAGFDLSGYCKGDLQIDDHHTVEDLGLVLGQAFAEALGDKAGIARFADVLIPMDEALVFAAVDISGRGQLHYRVEVPIEMLGNFDTTLAEEFFIAFTSKAGVTLHLESLAGKNSHHILEATFKAAARALREAVSLDARVSGIPSTKGSL
ncbi:MAG: imidazoleglycerol-phosphate dehydratase HisB [Coriobacteriia bacterium]|nr:imidazoleglycerol-phosphate dehydratase HisB [Coriobacteriia bacterium]MCL2746901.1 imidazoleglycerol-phosphate dehydratase HisB [Coriobacteriia bacterium]MCL2871138.1 imidazoleglycerol-phosphate dehydratase HisB [Coriobacteriia bacterium]